MAKVLVGFDDDLLRRIDRAARTGGQSRSAYLSGLVEGDMNRRTGPGKSPLSRAALRKIDSLGADAPGDSTEAIRVARDAH